MFWCHACILANEFNNKKNGIEQIHQFTQPVLNTSERDGMIDNVEGGRKVEENEWSDLTTIHRKGMVIMNFTRVVSVERKSRLADWKKLEEK